MRRTSVAVLLIVLFTAGVAMAGIFGDMMSIGGMKYTIVRAPEAVLSNVKTLAVVDFEGKAGGVYAGALVTAIKEPNKTGPDKDGNAAEGLASGLVESAASAATGGVSDVVSGAVSMVADLGSAPVYEQGLTTNVFTVTRDPNGADAVISGTMETQGPSDSTFQAERITYNAKGEKTKKTINCRKREASLTVRLNIKGNDGSILYSNDSKTGTYAQKCDGDSGSLPSGDTMFQQMAQKLAAPMAVTFCPYYSTRTARFQKDKKTKPSVKIVTKDKDWAKGVAVWANFVATDPYNYPALYNLGIANEVHGNYDEALSWYNKAETAKSHRRNKRAINRVTSRKAEVERLKGYGMNLQAYTWEKKAPTTMVVTIKGKAKNRCPIFQQASADSPEVIQLPGKMKVDIMTMEGEWCQIKTADGQFVGWIEKDNLDIKN